MRSSSSPDFVGTFAGGWLGDYWLKYSRQAYLWMSGWITLLAVPVVYVALAAGSPSVFYPALIAAELLLFMSTGPINTAIVNLVSPAERASAVALSVLAIHLLGDVLSPVPHRGAVGSVLARQRGDGRARRRRGRRGAVARGGEGRGRQRLTNARSIT